MSGLQEVVQPFSDEELTELALAAGPDTGVTDDSMPIGDFLDRGAPGGRSALLPGWYMPPPMGTSHLLRGWRRRIVLLIVASFVLINAYGLCSTYGHVGFG